MKLICQWSICTVYTYQRQSTIDNTEIEELSVLPVVDKETRFFPITKPLTCRYWILWTRFAIVNEMTRFAWASWRMLVKLIKEFFNNVQMWKYFCHSASSSTGQKKSSSLKRIIDSWVSGLTDDFKIALGSFLKGWLLFPLICRKNSLPSNPLKWNSNQTVYHFAFVLFTVAPTGDHVISLVDEISFTFPPAPPLSQIDDIPPEQFCNGDNRPADCGANCMCTHQVDIPHNAVVEVVLVDEGAIFF